MKITTKVNPGGKSELLKNGIAVWFMIVVMTFGWQGAKASDAKVESLSCEELARNFSSPPESAKPQVFWQWLNGNVTREGITADLKALARVGIGGALIFDVGGSVPQGPVECGSPEWRELVKHAAREAKRLGIELGLHNSPGFTGSGGAWVPPERSMQKLVSSQVRIQGGQRFEGPLPQPEAVKGFYRDIAVWAVPAATPGGKVWDRSRAVDLTARMDASGKLQWDAPAGTWDVLRMGHTSTGKGNHPTPPNVAGLQCDKLSAGKGIFFR